MPPSWHVGAVLAGKYRVDRIVGEGGMGVVVAATHLELEEQVAVKLLHGAAGADATVRFLREGKAAARIKSDHAVKVRDVGRLEDGTPYMVMELLEGEDLAAIAERGGASVASAVDWTLQACDALAEAHRRGVVHRDLKPSNIFLARRRNGEPLVKVLDFGISKLQSDAPDPRKTSTTDVFGSPMYMSPEQLHSTADVDPRTDVWSLATVLFEVIAGRPAFLADSLALLHVAILQAPAPDPTTFRADVPPPLAAALKRALAKSRDERTPSIAAFAAEIVPFATAVGRAAFSAIVASGANDPASTGSSAAQTAVHAAVPPRFVDTQGAFAAAASLRGPWHGGVVVAGFVGFLLLAAAGVALTVLAVRPGSTNPASKDTAGALATDEVDGSALAPTSSADASTTKGTAEPTASASADPPTISSADHHPPTVDTNRRPIVAPPRPTPSGGRPVLPEGRL